MINFNKLIIVDFETTGKNPERCQPVELAAVVLDGRRLNVYDGGIFQSYCNIIPDEEVDKYDLDPIEKDAMTTHSISMKTIESAPPLKIVWNNFLNFMKFHNEKNDNWKAPIYCGQNTTYDLKIIERIQKGHLGGYRWVLDQKPVSKTTSKKMSDTELADAYKNLSFYKEPWKFGEKSLFHPVLKLDLLQEAFMWWESNKNPHKLNQDLIKSFLGLESEGAHNGLTDCLYCAEILVRFLRLTRQVSEDTEFENACAEETILPIKKILEEYSDKS